MTTGILYHELITDRRGEALLPLSTLGQHHPDLYVHHRSKYDHNPAVEFQPVPPLSCRWCDVVFLSPVPPQPLFDAMARAGRSFPPLSTWTLDAALLDPALTTIKLMRHGRAGHHPDPSDADDYLPFTTASLRAVNRVTIDAIDRLEHLQPGDPALPWVDVPHILHAGPVPWSCFQEFTP